MTSEALPKSMTTVLLVDDHDAVLRALRSSLEKKGYNLIEARDGEQALLLAAHHEGAIHVLVTDLAMRPMNGRELIQRLAPLRPEMKVIMMSGFPDEIMALEALDPQYSVLEKPFLPKKLLQEIERVLVTPQPHRSDDEILRPHTFAASPSQ